VSIAVLLALAPAASADVFGPPSSFNVGLQASRMESGDFNRDGHTDLVIVGGPGLGTVSVLLGIPGGGFVQSQFFNAPDPNCVAVADFNGDGDPDLAIGDGAQVTVRLGGDGATFGPPTNFQGTPVGNSIEAGDLNGDGDPDLVVSGGPAIQVLLGTAGGSFVLGQTLAGAGSSIDLALGDFERNGALDLAVADTTGFIRLRVGLGDGTFGDGPTLTAPGARRVIAADVDRDGDVDLVKGGQNDVTVFYGGAGVGFPTSFSTPIAQTAASLGVGDFNGDDDVDVVLGNAAGAVELLLGATGDTLAPAVSTLIQPTLPTISGLVVGEWTGDDRPDIVASENQNARVHVVPNVSAAQIETNPANLTFATQARGTLSTARTVTVSSTGERPLHVRAVRTLGLAKDSYVITGDSCSGSSVPAGGTCTFAVRFAPENAGAHEADLHVLSDAAASPIFSMSLNGTGGALPTGPIGATGAAGPPGTSGAATVRDRLAAAFATDRSSARAGKRVRLRFVSTLPGVATLELRRGTRVVRRVSDTVAAGRNVLALRAPRKRGRYRLTLTVTGGGQTVTDSARLTVKRRPT
jgi:hypothetical protein